jgi:hypothetical protein
MKETHKILNELVQLHKKEKDLIYRLHALIPITNITKGIIDLLEQLTDLRKETNLKLSEFVSEYYIK